jgi:16S rRNA (cytidine1402-2'-O)-methyltransferase
MLFVVATPIGNLEDLTFRAVRVLREADVIACEDTRQTRKLLDHYGITTPMVSYHDHNEGTRTTELIERMKVGAKVALVSDAGTPLISDPGFRLVAEARSQGIAVVPIPGASAALSALSASGLPTDEFRFCGFLPQKQTQRSELLRGLARDPATLIFYEAPHRILETLREVAALMPSRPVVVARELTKLHEEFLTGSADEILRELGSRPTVKGEITMLIGKASDAHGDSEDERPLAEAVAELERAGLTRMDAIKQVAKDRGLGKRDVYRELSGGGR